MRKLYKILILAAAITASTGLYSQPQPPNGATDPDGGNTPLGGGAPIDGGLSILLMLGVGYGTKKFYDFRKRQLAE